MLLVFVLLASCRGTLVGYDVDQILSTQVYSLLPSDKCVPSQLNTMNITRGALVLYAPEVDVELKYCLFKASYTVGRITHSGWNDDAFYLTEESRPIPTYYPIKTWVCRSAWAGEEFQLPGFGNKKFTLEAGDFMVDDGEWPLGFEKIFRFTANFKKGKGHGVTYAWQTTWKDPLGNTIKGNIVIEGQLILGKMNANLD